ILLRSLGIELLHARRETAGEGGDRRHGQPKYIYWTHLAGVADVRAHSGWERVRDGAVRGGMAEGDVGSSGGECWSDAELGKIGPTQTESGWDRDSRLRGCGSCRASLGLDSRGRLSLRNRCPYASLVRYNNCSCPKNLSFPLSTRRLLENSPPAAFRGCQGAILGSIARV